jgi:hypothetical protein
MGRHYSKERKRTSANRAPKTVFAPSLNNLEYGQVVYARVPWGDNMDEWKTRPAIFLQAVSRHEAEVLPLYSRPRAADSIEVELNSRRCYVSFPAVIVDKLDIVATLETNLASDLGGDL